MGSEKMSFATDGKCGRHGNHGNAADDVKTAWRPGMKNDQFGHRFSQICTDEAGEFFDMMGWMIRMERRTGRAEAVRSMSMRLIFRLIAKNDFRRPGAVVGWVNRSCG